MSVVLFLRFWLNFQLISYEKDGNEINLDLFMSVVSFLRFWLNFQLISYEKDGNEINLDLFMSVVSFYDFSYFQLLKKYQCKIWQLWE